MGRVVSVEDIPPGSISSNTQTFMRFEDAGLISPLPRMLITERSV